MAKIRNKRIYSNDIGYLKFLADELDFIGREYKLDVSQGLLVVYALPPLRKKKKGEREKHERNKRAEKHARS
jgi:hypothetical protein